MWKTVLIFIAISLGAIYSAKSGSKGYNIQLVEVSLFLLFFFMVIRNYNKGIRIQINVFEKVFLILQLVCGTYAILTYFWSDQGISVFPGAISIFEGFIAFILAKIWLKESINSYEIANRFFLLSIVIQLILNMGLNLSSIDNQVFYALKSQSVTLMGGSNYLSIFLGFFFLYEFISRKKYWIMFALISILGIFLTLSRGAILSIAVSLLVYFIITLLNSKVNKLKSIISLVLLSLVAFYMFNYTIMGIDIINKLNDSIETGNSAGRNVLIEIAIKQITSQPFGNGMVLLNDPHNVFINSIRDLGVIIGPVYFILLVYPLYHLLKLNVFKYSNTTLALLIGYLSVILHSFVEIFYFNSQSIIWSIFTLVAINKMIFIERSKETNVSRSQSAEYKVWDERLNKNALNDFKVY